MPAVERCRVQDVVTFGARTLTPQGFLRAPAQIARTGIQEYLASELGFHKTRGMKAGDIVRLYRPAEEVFSQDTLASFEGQTLTMGHPADDVEASNWKKLAVGDFSGLAQKDAFVCAEVTVRDADAVIGVIKGRKQLSCGYVFDCDMTPGKTADGAAYDGVMRNIRGNHLAIVDRARGGPGCRIADGRITTTTEGDTMATRPIRIGDTELEIDTVHAAVIDGYLKTVNTAKDKAIADLAAETKRATDAVAALATLQATHDAALVAHTAALKTATDAVPTAAAIEQLAEERSRVVADGLTLFPELKAAGKSIPAIRLEVVQHLATGDGVARDMVLAVCGVEDEAKAADTNAKADENRVKAAMAAALKATPAADAVTVVVERKAADAATGRTLGGNHTAAAGSGGKLRGQDKLRENMRNGFAPPRE